MTPAEIANKWKKHKMPQTLGGIRDKEYVDELQRDIQMPNIEARIQERKTHIYVLEQDLLDHSQDEGDGLYTKEYCQFMADEISNHRAYTQDLEKELENLK